MFGLSIGTIISIALAVMKLASAIILSIKQDQLIALGSDSEKARAAATALEVARTLRDSDERIARLSDAEVLAELTKEGDFRD